MPKIETYRKRAKQIRRWHAEHNYSVGEKVRQVERLRELTDVEVLAMPMPLALSQEIVAIESGFSDWAALKDSLDGLRSPPPPDPGILRLKPAVPILFVRDVAAAAEYYVERLGFARDFLHGDPPFYGAVSRDGACFHLRHVGQPNFAELAALEGSLIVATVEVSDVKALQAEIEQRGAEITLPLMRQAWGGLTFHVRDPDGNEISFVTYDARTG